MKTTTFVISIFLLFGSNIGFADCRGPLEDAKCLTNVYNNGRNISNYNGYSGSSGNKHQYDLIQPSNNLQYQLNSNAQGRDQMDVGPGTMMDSSQGENGGGIDND